MSERVNRDIIAAAANLAQEGAPEKAAKVSEHRAKRYESMDFDASVTTTTGMLPNGTPALFISQRSHRTDLVESDVVLNMRQAVVGFCQLLAFTVGLEVAFKPIVPPQNPA